jgi:Tol biopolymer transport system component
MPLNRVNAPGMLLTPPGSSVLTNVVWSADGSRVYMGLAPAGSGIQGLYEIIVSNRAVRLLVGSVTPSSVRSSPDGSLLYFTYAGALWRLPSGGGTVEEVRSQVAYLWHVTDDSAGLVFDPPSSDSAWVIGSTSGTATALPPGYPLLYSPPGDEMLYWLSGTGASGSSAVIVSLLDGTARPSGITPDSTAEWMDTRWGADGIQLLLARGHATSWVHGQPDSWRFDYTIRGPTGSETAAFSESISALTTSVAWSPDGSRVAFWEFACRLYDAFGDCAGPHSALYAVDIRSGVTTWLAGADIDAGSGDVGRPKFSPNSRAVVYSLGGQLYLSRVP